MNISLSTSQRYFLFFGARQGSGDERRCHTMYSFYLTLTSARMPFTIYLRDLFSAGFKCVYKRILPYILVYKSIRVQVGTLILTPRKKDFLKPVYKSGRGFYRPNGVVERFSWTVNLSLHTTHKQMVWSSFNGTLVTKPTQCHDQMHPCRV
jgi:hypothetical protein